MANPATSVDMPGVVHLHDTTAIDRELGSGLSLTTVPAAGFAAGPPDSSEDMAARLGLDVVESYEPTDEAVLAILAGIVDATDAETGLARIRELMRGLPGHPLAGVEPRTREFVEHCAFAPIIAVEESLLSPKVLTAMVTAAGSICVGIVAVGAAPVLVAAGIGVGTVLVVAALGPPAIAIGQRLADAIAPG